MVWFKVDDTLAFHHKTIAAGNAAMGLWVRAGACCLDGVVPDVVVRALGTRRQASKLVRAGLWARVEHGYEFIPHGPKLLCSWVRDDSRPKIPDTLRQTIYARDGHQCLECGARDDLTLDHVWPWSRGGADTIDNLRTLCRSCNSRKGARV